ncbi:MAG: enhanced serine sensitivity protein SseB C-terminal domain-containing protein, partial [Candidatus Limnocylindria bacterium]
LGDLPELEVPEQIPEPFGRELHAALAQLPQVRRAWLLRAESAWTAGVQLDADALLADFDAVRNRLHAVATEHLGSRRMLAVTDLRSAALRDTYDATAAPFYARHEERKGLLSRLLGG